MRVGILVYGLALERVNMVVGSLLGREVSWGQLRTALNLIQFLRWLRKRS